MTSSELEFDIAVLNGQTCYKLRGLTLHSLRAPEREAQRWIESFDDIAQFKTIFLIGDASGCVTRALRTCAPHAMIAVLAGKDTLAPTLLHAGADQVWYPGSVPLETFLSAVLEAQGPQNVRTLVWPAFERAVPEIVQAWLQTFLQVYRVFQGSWLTRVAFIERFGRNAVRNLVRWERPFLLKPGDRPVVLAASGPSLEETLPWMKEKRALFQLWALPSSLDFLISHGLLPDFAIVTDGGWYTRELLWATHSSEIAFLCGLGVAADRALETHPTIFFPQGSPWETPLIRNFPAVLPVLPSQGTVAVSAVNLALASTQGPVLVVGMDLVLQDLKLHPNPHPSLTRVTNQTQRLAPLESLLFEQFSQSAKIRLEGNLRTTSAMQTYRLWLDETARFARTVFRLKTRTGPTWRSMKEVDFLEAETLLGLPGTTFATKKTWQGHWPRFKERHALVLANLEELSRSLLTDNALLLSLAPEESDPGSRVQLAQERLLRWKKSL
jgi:hypothetical protein